MIEVVELPEVRPSLGTQLAQPTFVVVDGGDADSSTLEGSYSSERRTRGTEPAEVRRYVPGETADNID